MELQDILKSLKNLSSSDLLTLSNNIVRHIYAKGVEDYLQAAINLGDFKEDRDNNDLTNI